MRTAAEVHERAAAIDADLLAPFGQIGNRLNLVVLALFGKQRPSLVGFDRLVLEPVGLFGQPGHGPLDLREIIGAQLPRQLEIVVETVLDRRPEAKFGLGKDLLDRGGHNVRAGVAHPLKVIHVGLACGYLIKRRKLRFRLSVG